MKKSVITAVMAMIAVLGFAQEKKEPRAQQALMASCNKEATGKKGEERKAFMQACLSDGKMRQQERMKACNASAKDKKGEERKKFMSECLKK